MTTRYLGASATAIEHHYDASNAFYALWLDEAMVYSCALFDGPPGESLHAAQLRKLDLLSTGAHAPGARRVLDIGCGWGALLARLTGHHQVGQATGLTLSTAQAEHLRARADPRRCTVRVENWIDHQPEEGYDAIVSIGAFEHFADFGLGRAGRVAAYREFFARCRDWLPPGGRLALQTNIKGNNTEMDRQTVRDMLFIVDTIFPESELPWLSEILEASERLFDPVTVRNDPDHYALTCREWERGLRARRAEAVALVGEQVVADYERYLAAAAAAFDRRHLGLARLVLQAGPSR